MTDAQICLVLGSIWVAPHAKEWWGDLVGIFFVFFGIFKLMGWA
jgi:hypothetical protein